MGKRHIVKKEAVKKKKKLWFSLIAPKIFRNVELGETLAVTAEDLKDKRISLSLGVITKQPRKSNTTIKFNVDKIQEGKGQCEVIGYELSSAHVKRVVRKGKTRIDESIVLTTKDKVDVRLKPLLITVKKVNSSKEKELRTFLKQYLKEQVSNLTFDKLIESIVSFELQGNLKRGIVSIHPVSFCDIRVMKRVEKKN
tara:strand:- start:53 stop:643 length:591 start_codon:yes stop_codon:yes gene_type:complete